MGDGNLFSLPIQSDTKIAGITPLEITLNSAWALFEFLSLMLCNFNII